MDKFSACISRRHSKSLPEFTEAIENPTRTKLGIQYQRVLQHLFNLYNPEIPPNYRPCTQYKEANSRK